MSDSTDNAGNLEKVPEISSQLSSAKDNDRGGFTDKIAFLKKIFAGLQKKYGLNSKVEDVCANLDFAPIIVRMLSWWQGRYTVDEKKSNPDKVSNMSKLLLNLSDSSDKFRVEFAKHGGIKVALADLKSNNSLLTTHDERQTNMAVEPMLGILYNTAKSPVTIHTFRENNAAKQIAPYTKSENLSVRTTAILTMATILDEEETFVDTDTISFIVEGIETAQQFHGFQTIELLDGLARLVVSDKHKDNIIEAGVLPIFVKLLFKDNKTFAKEKVVILRIIWHLTFVNKMRQDILTTEGLLDAVEKSTTDDNKEISDAATGVLWKLKTKKKHIFISYEWDNQKTVVKLKDRLELDGYEVWMDLDRMSGSTLEAMASAVEGAAIVLICMSERYKQSPNCRTEGEYTYKRKKNIIPLMMERHYEPDGWLGAILGSKLYIAFNGEESFEQAYDKLKRELKLKGGELTADVINGTTAITPATTQPPDSWPPQMVQQWRKEHGLESVELLKNCDGAMLFTLKKTKKEAPEFFHCYMWKEVKISLYEILKLSKALDSIQ